MSESRSAASAAIEPEPLGTVIGTDGVHFNVFSSAEQVELVLFDRVDDGRPAHVVELERRPHSCGRYWHRFVAGVGAGQVYGYRADGPFAPQRGLRFDREKLLLDPYAQCVASPRGRTRSAASARGETVATGLRSVVVDSSAYDWGNDRPPRVPYSRTVIYEMHVGNFTRHPSSGLAEGLRGTFAGVTHKIPYLIDLGVSAVELMPIFAFDEQAAPPTLRNVWGYEPLSFFAPHSPYSSRGETGAVLDEFRDMIKALHQAGIEVILDVVYNHTAEDDVNGPTLSYRGLANEVYYMLAPDGSYANYSGVGNTLNVNSPVVSRLVLDSLRYWVRQMHVDGFRFDLAAVLLRDSQGVPTDDAPVLRAIQGDPALQDIKLIAEPWDAAGLYALGRMTHQGLREWNGRFRDDARRFVKSDWGTVRPLACRLVGSPDIYPVQHCTPTCGINFVTSHDGFTLNDLVSYNHKHNAVNREDNRDGVNDNYSWNCGVEGPTQDGAVNQLRLRQVKNLLALTLLAAGTPMVLMGDEVRRTQAGNNNGYCLEAEVAGLDWGAISNHAGVYRFARELIGLRTGRSPSRGALLGEAAVALTPRSMQWHGVRVGQPDWSEDSHSLAVQIECEGTDRVLYLLLNAYWGALTFELPQLAGGHAYWRRCMDTARTPPEDICFDLEAPLVSSPTVLVEPRSVVALVAAPTRAGEG
ncbi:MAG TPA: glycogen debranching protein GlgX [Steroidobacteraceae bacterium]|nr:glycogen debranching protein GlgX [Steroidobacteraceae bacterium]